MKDIDLHFSFGSSPTSRDVRSWYMDSRSVHTVYSRLEWGGVPARAQANREWQSNKTECFNSDLVPKTGLNCARKNLYVRSAIMQCLGRGLPPYLSIIICFCRHLILSLLSSYFTVHTIDVHSMNYTSLYVCSRQESEREEGGMKNQQRWHRKYHSVIIIPAP